MFAATLTRGSGYGAPPQSVALRADGAAKVDCGGRGACGTRSRADELTVDVNVLVYASDESSAFHAESSRAGRTARTRGPDLLYLFWPVVMGYLRIATHPAIFPSTALRRSGDRKHRAAVGASSHAYPGRGDTFWHMYGAATSRMVVRNLVPDAHLVSHAGERRRNAVDPRSRLPQVRGYPGSRSLRLTSRSWMHLPSLGAADRASLGST